MKKEVTVVRGENGLGAIYLDGTLMSTFDKNSAGSDIEYNIKRMNGLSVVETAGEFKHISEIPSLWKKSLFASEVAERYAAEMGIDPDQITGTGRNGVITKPDITAYLESLTSAEKSEGTDDEEV